jgi:hypothetical protein
MHERIQYLAEQAILEGPQGQVDFQEFINIFSDKFSSLILEECAMIAESYPADAAELIKQMVSVNE